MLSRGISCQNKLLDMPDNNPVSARTEALSHNENSLILNQFKDLPKKPIHCQSRTKSFAIIGEIFSRDGDVMKDNSVVHKDRRATDHTRSNTDRRSSEDRRSNQQMPETPFVDGDGVKVTRDRRHAADRRIKNIEVDWQEDEEDNSA